MASYPNAAATFPARTDGQTIFAQHVQLLQDEIAAIEAGLLTTGFQHALWAAQAVTLSGTLTPPTLTVSQDNYAPAGLATASVLRLQLGANINLTGLLAQPAGRLLCLVVFGGFTLTLKQQSASSAATNQFLCPGAVDLPLPNGSTAWLWYDTVNSAWRVVATATPPAAASAVTYIGAKVYNASGTVALTAATYTTLSFPTAEFNLGTMWAAGSPTRLTVPAGQGGVYLFYAKYQNATGANNRLRFMKNGAVCSTESRPGYNSAAAAGGMIDTALLQLNAGDYVEVQAYANVASTIGGTTRDDASEFGAFKQNPT